MENSTKVEFSASFDFLGVKTNSIYKKENYF